MPDLTPMNRTEAILAGEDLEPTNRLEYFLKQAGSGGGSTPSLPAEDGNYNLNIADGTASWQTASGGGELQALTIYATGTAQESSGSILVPTNLTSQIVSETLFDSDTGRQLVPVFIAAPAFSGTSPYYTYEDGTYFRFVTNLGSETYNVGAYTVALLSNPGTGDLYLQATLK